MVWIAPQGNADDDLARRYIATELTLLAEADPTDVQDAFDEATALLETDTPDELDDLKGKDRKDWTDLADDSEGDTGPGHCREDGNRAR